MTHSQDFHADKDFWTNLRWPAAPNDDDRLVFSNHAKGRVLLLGSTQLLLPLCTEAWDINPKYADPKIRDRDWFNLDEHWDTIMIDGGLAFGKEFTARLLPIVLAHCDTFVARVFLNPNWPTKYAVYFPRAEELTPRPLETKINEIYSFYVWNK